MDCPKCKARMESVEVDQYEIDRCTACGGLWFDLREHEHLKDIAGSERVDTGKPADGPAPSRAIDCPRCKTGMIRMTFVEQPHIQYEMCSVCHGLYLDAGEFKDFKQTTVAERIRHAFGHLFG